MNVRFNSIALALSALVLLLAAVPTAGAADAPISLGDAYRQIKDAEHGCPVPAPAATTDQGTSDAATGASDGLATEIEIINHKPVRIVPVIHVNAVNARLVFHLTHATSSVRLSATGGAFAFARAGATSISIDVGRE